MSILQNEPPSRARPTPAVNQSEPPSQANSNLTPTLTGSTPRNGSFDQTCDHMANERSPLLRPGPDDDDLGDGNTVLGDSDDSQQTKSVWYLILLTISIGGLQIAWSVELSNGSPYLLSLGLSKSLMALVWIAGPLTGTLVQPYVGMLSDNCRVPWGKRKPFMVGGTIATIISLIFLAWTKEIVGNVLGLFGAHPESQGVRIAATIGSSIIFRIWQKPRGTPGDHSISVVLALGGIAVLVSSFFVASIHENTSMPLDATVAAEEGDGEGSRPMTARSRSYGHLPRATLQRATLTRNKSFGGLEY
ncbi:hypothetical protein BN1708_000793, partial [Verticillium longisporum]